MRVANSPNSEPAIPTAVTLLFPILLAGCPASNWTSYAGPPVALAELADARITEASGLAASRRNPGCYYVHNDSGDAARVFLVDRKGVTRLVINLEGVTAIDFEDIAIAPGDDGFDVCAADIGDNQARRSTLAVYRFPEVDLATLSDMDTTAVSPTTYRFRYADSPANAEAFIVDPTNGDGYVFTKRLDGKSAIYRLSAPWDASRTVSLQRVTMIELPPGVLPGRIITAADISPNGRRLAARCYIDGWEWESPNRETQTLTALLGHTPKRLSLATEIQGEAICYSATGDALLTISEGRHPTLFELPAIIGPPTKPR